MALRSPRNWNALSRVGVDLAAVARQGQVRGRDLDLGHLGTGAFAFRATGGLRRRTTGRSLALRTSHLLADLAGIDVVSELPARDEAREVARFESQDGSHIVLQRQLDGLDVYGSTVKVHLESSGVTLTGDTDSDLSVHAPRRRPRIEPEQAVEIAGRMLPGAARLVRPPEVVIFPTPDGGRLAHVVTLLSKRPIANLRVYVDAASGSILLAFNRATTASGFADVFEVNPARSAAPIRVQLDGLADPPGDALSGLEIAVTTGRPPDVTSAGRDFVRQPADPSFDEPACYFFIGRGLEYFSRFYEVPGFGSPPFRPIRAIVNDPRSPRNARFVPDEGLLRFGGGSRPWARSGEIVVHELGHALTHALSRLADAPSRSQCRGLAEGYSDYFASSLFEDPRFGDYVAPGQERDCSNGALRFKKSFRGDEHDTGAVWAAVLWDLRASVGAPAADRIVAKSVVYLAPFSGFDDGLEALVKADRAISSPAAGANETQLRRLYAARL